MPKTWASLIIKTIDEVALWPTGRLCLGCIISDNSNGSLWKVTSLDPLTFEEYQAGSGGIPSNPTSGNYVVTNIYVRAQGTKLEVEYDDTPVP